MQRSSPRPVASGLRGGLGKCPLTSAPRAEAGAANHSRQEMFTTNISGTSCVGWHYSTAIESPAAGPRLYYMNTLVTNILRKNSAVEHQVLATRLQELIAADHRAK